jgi:hypothetical protein
MTEPKPTFDSLEAWAADYQIPPELLAEIRASMTLSEFIADAQEGARAAQRTDSGGICMAEIKPDRKLLRLKFRFDRRHR